MPTVTFITADGSRQAYEARVGVSLMQVAVDNGVEAIVAECGGACSCATCHCYVDDAWISKVGEPDEIEHAMLECVLDPQPNSRLSCQLVMSRELDGLVVRFPDSQY